jgi:hypothetical protein
MNKQIFTPETDASCGYALSSHYGRLEGSYLQMDRSGPFVHAEFARKLERQRDEAMALANDLASAASHCLGWHDCRLNIGEKIATTLQRWSKLKEAVK